MGGKVKIGIKAPKIGGSLKIGGGVKYHAKVRIHIKAKAAYKPPKGYAMHVAPKDYLKGTACQASFGTAYKALYGLNHARKAVATKAFGCFKAIAQMRGELSCAVCDNTKEKYFKDANALNVKPENLKNLASCVMMIRYFQHYQTTLNSMLDFAEKMGKDVKTTKTALNALKLS